MKTNDIPASARSFLQSAVEGAMTHSPFSAAIGAPAITPPLRSHLTRRQLDVLALLCEGMTNKDISRQLGIGNATVKIHVSSILRALNVSSRLQATIVAQRMGLVRGKSRGANTEAKPAGRQPMVLRVVWDGESARIIGIAEEVTV